MPSATLVSSGGRLPRRAYLAITLFLTAMVVWGFWPSYYGTLLQGGSPRPWWIHVHAAIFAGWMVLLVAQSWLVSTGRTRIHRRIGVAGVVYAALVVLAGLAVTFATAVLHVRGGRMTLDGAVELLLFALVDIVLFAGFFVAAIACRRRPEAHKRLMIAATVCLAYAALSRPMSVETLLFLPAWLSPLLVAMAFDFAARRRVHPSLWISVGILTLAWARIYVMDSAVLLRIGRALVVPFL